MNKFKINDRVKVNPDAKLPKRIKDNIRFDRIRTLQNTFYYPKAQHTAYYLGSNQRGNDFIKDYAFRASDLILYKPRKSLVLKNRWVR